MDIPTFAKNKKTIPQSDKKSDATIYQRGSLENGKIKNLTPKLTCLCLPNKKKQMPYEPTLEIFLSVVVS